MRKLLIPVAALTLLVVPATGAFGAAKSVTVGDNYYVRSSGVPTVTVAKDSTVKWVFRGRSSHNVTVKTGPVKFKSGTKSSGSFSKTMTRKGTYVVYCTVHGARDQSMKLVVN